MLAHEKLRLRPSDDSGPVGQALTQLLQARAIFAQQGAGVAAAWLTAQRAVLASLTAADPDNWAEAWSQIRLLIDSVDDRNRSTTESPTEFAQWLRDTLTLAASTNSSVLHEPEAAGVTITTMHQAKGLQWPIVVTGAIRDNSRQNMQLTFTDSDVHTHLAKDYHYGDELVSDEFPEADRLLYVAMTRARDHLVVSDVASNPRGKSSLVGAVAWGDDVRVVEVPVTADLQPAAGLATGSARDAAAPEDRSTGAAFTDVRPTGNLGLASERNGSDPVDRSPSAAFADVTQRLAQVQQAATKTIRTATPSSTNHSGGGIASNAGQSGGIGITANPATEASDHVITSNPVGQTHSVGFAAGDASFSTALNQHDGPRLHPPSAQTNPSAAMAPAGGVAASHPESSAGDVAAGIGELVHAVLEAFDLAEFTIANSDIRTLATEVAQAHGWTDINVETAVTMLEGARASDVLQRANQAAVLRRELPISGSHLQDDGVLVVTQGIIDLLFQDAAGWVLVDYKTDSTNRSVAEFIDKYRGQLDAYQQLLADCGIPVTERWLVRMTPTGVTDIQV